MIIIIAVALLLLLVVWFISTYNNLVKTEEFVNNAKGQIAVQIESRWDALTNMIQAAKKYSEYEANTLKEVIDSRSKVTSDTSVDIMEAQEGMQERLLSRLIAISEAYPELKADGLYNKAMDNVKGFENNVRLARMTYNDTVTKYNRLCKTIPSSFVASATGRTPMDYFEVSNASKNEMPGW